MDEGRKTFIELLIGIVFWAFVVSIVGVFFTGNKLLFILGMLLGTIAAIVMSVSMYRSVDKSLDLEEEGAVKYTKKKAFLRILIMAAVVFFALVFSDYISVVGVVIGIFCLKLSAYTQPLTHIIFKKKL